MLEAVFIVVALGVLEYVLWRVAQKELTEQTDALNAIMLEMAELNDKLSKKKEE